MFCGRGEKLCRIWRQSPRGCACRQRWCLSIFCFFDLQHNGALAETFGAVPVSLVNKFLGLCKYVFRTGGVCPGGYVFLHTRCAPLCVSLVHPPSSTGPQGCHTNPGLAVHPRLEDAKNCCADSPGLAVLGFFLGVDWVQTDSFFTLGLWFQQSRSMCTQPACFNPWGRAE